MTFDLSNTNPKILIVGSGRAGKDTSARLITETFGHKFRGSSEVAAKEVVFPLMRNFYTSPEDAFNRRHENRELWYSLICQYNKDNPSRLAEKVCEGGSGYTGLRSWIEVVDCIEKGIFTHVVWVDNPRNNEVDPTMDFDCQQIKNFCRSSRTFFTELTNDGSIADLRKKIEGLKMFFRKRFVSREGFRSSLDKQKRKL